MPNQLQTLARKGGLLSALIAAIFAPQAFAIPAGKVDFAAGKVSATGPDGAARDLVKGAEINQGDSIATGDGRVQIRFTDGAYMSLQPNTVFKVENYNFAGKADGSEKGVFNLITGGLRTISGLIGKGKRENYELRTKTATIGIRGTAYSAQQTEDTLVVSVGEGRISITSQGGNLVIGSGQSAIVRSPRVSPEMTKEKALAPQGDVQTQETKPPEQTAAAGEQRTTTGVALPVSPVVSSPTGTPVPAPTVLVTGSGFSMAYSSVTPAPTVSGNSYHYGASNVATFDAAGTLKSISDGANNFDFTAGAAIPAPETGSDTLIGWGRWTGTLSGPIMGGSTTNYPAPNAGLHYVTGIPIASTSPILVSGATVTYNLLGHTYPTSIPFSPNPATLGTLSGPGTVSVNFASAPGTPTMFLNFTVNGSGGAQSYNMAQFGNIPFSWLGGLSVYAGGATGSTCTNCNLSISGLFTGANADRMGLTYLISDSATAFKTGGAAAFTKAAGAPPP
jgi:hypothetical protein